MGKARPGPQIHVGDEVRLDGNLQWLRVVRWDWRRGGWLVEMRGGLSGARMTAAPGQITEVRAGGIGNAVRVR